jgi:hypothetical protein
MNPAEVLLTSVLDKEDTSSRVMMRFPTTHQPEREASA